MRRWVWFGLVWFMILALVLVLAGPGSGKVQSRSVRCGAVRVCGCMRRREMSQVGVLFQVEPPGYLGTQAETPLSLWGICLLRVAGAVWSGSERGPKGDEICYWIVTDGPGPSSSPTKIP